MNPQYDPREPVGRAEDADGEALRRLEEGGFDFSKPCLIDFFVDFQNRAPHSDALILLRREYPSLVVCETEDGAIYLEFQIYARVSYELVTNIQDHVTELMAPFRGVCCSWGVMFDMAMPSYHAKNESGWARLLRELNV